MSTPTNPPGSAVTSTPAPSGDTNSLVELDRRHAVGYVLDRAIAWQQHRGTALADVMEAELDRAITAYRGVAR